MLSYKWWLPIVYYEINARSRSCNVFLLQTILVGDSGVGKTSLLVQFDQGKFIPGSFSATVGIGFTVCICTLCIFNAGQWVRKKPASSQHILSHMTSMVSFNWTTSVRFLPSFLSTHLHIFDPMWQFTLIHVMNTCDFYLARWSLNCLICCFFCKWSDVWLLSY